MLNQPKNFIFDLDGTLVDSAQQIGNCLNKARLEFGFERLSTSQINEKVGVPINIFLEDLKLSKELENRLIERFRILLSQAIGLENTLYGGVIELLSDLKQRGHTISIATSKPTYLAKKVVASTELKYFVDITQGTDDFPAKPKPDVIFKVIGLVPGSGCLMIGDRSEDIEAAIAAGIPGVGVAHSHHSVSTLLNSGAELAFESISGLHLSLNLVEMLVI